MEPTGPTRLPPLDPTKWCGGTTPDDPFPELGGPAHGTRRQAGSKDNSGSLVARTDSPEDQVTKNMTTTQDADSHDTESETLGDDTIEDDTMENDKMENDSTVSDATNRAVNDTPISDKTTRQSTTSKKEEQVVSSSRFVIISDIESCGTSLFSLTERQATEILQSALGLQFDPSGEWSKASRKKQIGITCKDDEQFRKALNIHNFVSKTPGIKLVAKVPQLKCWGQVRHIHQHVVPEVEDLKDKLTGARINGLDSETALETCLANLTFTRRNTVIKTGEDRKRIYKDGKPVIEETNTVQLVYYGESLPQELRFDGLGWRNVEPYAFKVQHCWRCLGYTHLGRDCKSISCHCGYCGGPHSTKDCDKKGEKPMCHYCKKDHPVWSKDCPRRKQEQELAQIRAGTTMTRAMAWKHLKEKERKREDQVSRENEIKRQVGRMENHLSGELDNIYKHTMKELEKQDIHAVKELDRQNRKIMDLEAQVHKVSLDSANEKAKANRDIKDLQHENKTLQQEMKKLKEDMALLRAELDKRANQQEKREQVQLHRDKQREFGDFDPLDRFENRDIVFRTDKGPRRHISPQRQAVSPRRHEESPPRRPPYTPNHKSAKKVRQQNDAVAVRQWEARYEDQGGRHNYGPMKTLSYSEATYTGPRNSRSEQPRARREGVYRR